jgi:hypothetical protein
VRWVPRTEKAKLPARLASRMSFVGTRGGVVRLSPTWPDVPRYAAEFAGERGAAIGEGSADAIVDRAIVGLGQICEAICLSRGCISISCTRQVAPNHALAVVQVGTDNSRGVLLPLVEQADLLFRERVPRQQRDKAPVAQRLGR